MLGELVDKGFVDCYGSLEEVISALGGDKPTLSKLALITTLKEGVLNHRLILDCRVSGVNDHSRKTERVLLPSAWDIIHDTLAMRAKMKDAEALYYMV